MGTRREMEHSREFQTDSELQCPEYVKMLFVIENRTLCARDYLYLMFYLIVKLHVIAIKKLLS